MLVGDRLLLAGLPATINLGLSGVGLARRRQGPGVESRCWPGPDLLSDAQVAAGQTSQLAQDKGSADPILSRPRTPG
eukprot:5871459-Amphidinium_carterae.2